MERGRRRNGLIRRATPAVSPAWLAVVLAAAALAAPHPAPAAPAPPRNPDPAAKLRVVVAVAPQAWLAERVGGTHLEVETLVGPGQSPHTFEPTPRQMARVAEARLLLTVGWPFEKRLLEKVTPANPGLQVIDTRQGLALRRLTDAEARADAGHEPADHEPAAPEPAGGAAGDLRPDSPAAPPTGSPPAAGDADPHVWLNPRNARAMAAAMARAFAAADPDHADEYRRNLAALQDDLDRLDARIARALAPLKGKEFLVYHPAFGYFAEAYGLRQVPVEIEGKEPSARQLADLVARARAGGIRVVFVQPQFSAKSAEALAAAIGGAVVPMDPLARDYAANLADVADKIRKALAPAASAAREPAAEAPGDARPPPAPPQEGR